MDSRPLCLLRLRPMARFLPSVLFATMLAGCSSIFGIRPPVPTILQGNIYDSESLEQLESGMTENQVLYILGTPLLRPLHRPNEWYYYRSAVRENQTLLRRLLVLRFEDSKLQEWDIRHQAEVPDDFTKAASQLHKEGDGEGKDADPIDPNAIESDEASTENPETLESSQ